MIDRENLKKYENILEITNPNTNLSVLDKLLYYIEHEKDNELLKTLLELYNPSINVDYLFKVIHAIKDNPEIKDTLLDSFSSNQEISKTALLNAVNNVVELGKDSTVVIWGSWYGSILIPKLAPKVKRVVCIDLDNTSLQIAKNKLFNNYENIDYICGDLFEKYRDTYIDTNLIINTSCEHMPPMKDWPWFRYSAMATDTVYPKGYADDKPHRKKVYGEPKLSDNCYFVFQSNNMFGIEGHINCVNSLEEFKDQMPERAKILYEEEVEDTRGTRYMLVGKFMPL
jgi:hypothetical protein